MKRDWKKIVLTIVAGSVAGSIGGWAQNSANGVNVPFTAGTILLPAVATAAAAVAALFVKPPHKEK